MKPMDKQYLLKQAQDCPGAGPAAPQSHSPPSAAYLMGSENWTAAALFGLTIVLILGSRIISPGLGGWQQAQAILLLSSFTIVLGFGQGLVVLIGGLDLSVGSLMSLGGILAFGWAGGSLLDLLWSLPCILAITGLIGTVNGLGVTVLRLPPFIMTLATSLIVYGVILGFTGGWARGLASPVLVAIYIDAFLGVPIILWVLLILVALGTLLQSHTSFGRRLYAVGTNAVAAYIAGVPVRLLTIAAYTISGVTAGFAGMLLVGYATGANLIMGQAYLLPSVAAVVIGGASITGGRGIYLGTVGGALLLTTLSTIISAIGLGEGWRTVIYGTVILLALLLVRDNNPTGWLRMTKPFGRKPSALATSGSAGSTQQK